MGLACAEPPRDARRALPQDPINPTNNLGYNCYRLHQIQRAMSEALAVLERHEMSGPQPPPSPEGWHLLQCLLAPVLAGILANSPKK